MKKTYMIGLLGLALASGISNAALIAPLLTSTSNISNSHTGVLGTTFTAPASGTAEINKFGFYDANGDGLTVAHDIGLYLWDGSNYILQAKATIAAGTSSTLQDGYRWIDIPTVTLSDTGGSAYLIYATTTASDGDSWGAQAPSSTVVGTAVTGWWGTGSIGALESSASLGGAGGAGTVYNIANVGYVIPEPSAALIGGLGMLALLRRRR